METENKSIKFSCLPPVSIIIFLTFFFAKVFNLIDWSWWWVFSPLWLPSAAILVLLIFGCIVLCCRVLKNCL